MPIEITARHLDINENLQQYARGKAETIAEEFPKIEHMRVILDKEKHRYSAEVTIQGKNCERMVASETSDNIMFSVDAAFDKAEKQLRKVMDKIQDHKLPQRKKRKEAEETE